jgi:hypothetical protein
MEIEVGSEVVDERRKVSMGRKYLLSRGSAVVGWRGRSDPRILNV